MRLILLSIGALLLMVAPQQLLSQRAELNMARRAIEKEISKVYGVEQFSIETPPLLAQLQSINGQYHLVKTNNTTIGYAYLGRVNSCRAGGCDNPSASLNDQTSEYFDYLILFNPDASIRQVKVISYQATHGQEITSKGWLKQFIGFAGQTELQVGKQVDAISGATISVYAITNNVNDAARKLADSIALSKK